MLGSPAPATVHTATTSATPASPTRPSRLRGLSYLRTYTHNHLHSHSSRSEAVPQPRTAAASSSPVTSNTPATLRRQNTNNVLERGSPVSPSRIESGENGWIPTIQGRSGLSRESLHPTTTTSTTSTTSASQQSNSTAAMMTRSRAAGAVGPTPANSHPSQRRHPSLSTPSTNEAIATSAQSTPSAPSSATASKDKLPTIRLMPHVETRSSRPSLHFSALSRTLKTPNSVVRVGRYSERDSISGDPLIIPVGFKSKVVSRRHCEFWCTEGQWYIKDVKSSSGTFLNHVRLSSPGVESRPYPVNDGDVVQLGIDFKGGEEVIFRCVKIRVECNRGWQKSLNSFNTSAHKRLLKSAVNAKARDSDAASVNSSECSICLNPVAPCQALFVAPCSHVWHYKCIRNLIHSPQWPNFLCPNCRFMADLEADVDEPEYEDVDIQPNAAALPSQSDGDPPRSGSSDGSLAQSQTDDEGDVDEMVGSNPVPRLGSVSRANEVDEDLAALLSSTDLAELPSRNGTRSSQLPAAESSTGTQPIAISPSGLSSHDASDPIGARSMTPTTHTQFALAPGPVSGGSRTPRNEAGPFIFDGNAGRNRSDNNMVDQTSTEMSDAASPYDGGVTI